jgi:quinol monooxygenase YgiN
VSEVALLVKGRAQPGRRDEVRRLFEQHLAPRAQQNDVQEIVVWCADERDPDAFYLFEVYRDRSSAEANAQEPWFGEYVAAVDPFLVGQPEMIMATPQWRKPQAS